MSRFALSLALIVFIVAELQGIPFVESLKRGAIGYGAGWLLQTVWRYVLWPWLRSMGPKPEEAMEEAVRRSAQKVQDEGEEDAGLKDAA